MSLINHERTYCLLVCGLVFVWLLSKVSLTHADYKDENSNHNHDIISDDEDDRAEPPFPQLFSLNQIGDRRIRLVIESVSDTKGYETIEEYYDFEIGKGALVTKHDSGNSVLHVDSQAGFLYRYIPYYCWSIKHTDVIAYEGLWRANWRFRGVKKAPTDARGSGEDVGEKEMHLFGVVALWLNAGEMSRTFSRQSEVDSASRDRIKEAYRWTIEDLEQSVLFHLTFIEEDSADGVKYSLETVELESLVEKKITHRMNILAYEYSIEEEIYESLFQVPLGYGCVDSQVTHEALIEFPSLKETYFGPLLSGSHRIQLEATATDYNHDSQATDTINVDLARTIIGDAVTGESYLQLVRERDSKRDLKRILNYQYNVQYIINVRLDTCEMININLGKVDLKLADSKAKVHMIARGEDEQVNLNFANGLKLNMTIGMMELLFVDMKEYYFVKNKLRNNKIEMLYFERSTKSIFGESIPCRIIRSYKVDEMDKIELTSVTIWALNSEESQILELYHLNVLSASKLDDHYLTKVRLFDVSEQCYLNNERMKEGQDFAWFQLTYPLPGRYSEALASEGDQLKQLIYHTFDTFGHLNFFRVPKMELLIGDSSIQVRALMLDVPALELLYDFHDHLTLYNADKKVGDFEEVTEDVKHCAKLCLLQRCRAMSFCQYNNLCVLSHQLPEESGRSLFPIISCKTFTQPKPAAVGSSSKVEQILDSNLGSILSILQHQDYSSAPILKMPEELLAAAGADGSDGSEAEKAMRLTMGMEYVSDVFKYLEQERHKLPMLTFTVVIGGNLAILVPNKFELELDPMRELGEEILEYDQDSLPPFHEGLSMRTYSSDVLGGPEARSFGGSWSWDQCAIACVEAAEFTCGSFSYCRSRKECIITGIKDPDVYLLNSTKHDPDCAITRRDFLHKFNRFAGQSLPQIYQHKAKASSASSCARICLDETRFKCMAFDYCQGPKLNANNQVETGEESFCFYLAQRRIYTGMRKINPSAGAANEYTDCDHYSRSYLADFVRIEYRQLGNLKLKKGRALSLLRGRSLDQCAEHCAAERKDCTAFQFCLDPEASALGLQRNCVIIEQKTLIPVNESSGEPMASDADSNGVAKVDVLEASTFCHVFVLRKERESARGHSTASNGIDDERQDSVELIERTNTGSGISAGSGFALFLCALITSTGLAFATLWAKNRNDYARRKIARLQNIFGIN